MEAVDLVAAVEEEAAALSEGISNALDDEGGETEAPSAPSAAEPLPDEVVTGTTPAADVGTPPEEAPAEEETRPDTTRVQGDITADTASAPATPPMESPAASQPAMTVQASPTNVNVSVRVESPGDDGPVTQVNLAAAVATGAAASRAEPAASEPAAGATQSGDGSAGAPAGSRAGGPAVSPSSQSSGAWTWEWDCLSVPAFTPISSAGSTSGSTPTNWTWIWNCGDNQEQYRGATTGQYQPVNVNVSIRVASPGDNGAVSQSNVAIAIGATRGGSTEQAPRPAPAPAPGVPVPGVPTGLPALPSLPGLSTLPVLPPLAGAPLPVEGGDLAALVVGAAIPSSDDPLDLSHVLPGLGRPAWVVPTASGAPSPDGASGLPGGASLRPILGPTLGPSALGDGLQVDRPRLGGDRSGVREGRSASAQEAVEPAPRWRTPVPTSPRPESAPFGTSASAASGGGSSGGGLPVFLALPFLAALLDLARRVAHERVALPSGHRGRARDDPG